MTADPASEPDTREPGYCITCGGFRLLTPVPGYPRGVCSDTSCREALEPPEPYTPGKEHICGVGGVPKPGHPHYRRCRCGRWYCYDSSGWHRGRPSAKWLRQHGYGDDLADFTSTGNYEERGSFFGEFFTSNGGWQYLYRRFLIWLGSRLMRS